ncbi:erythromycin esterase family protein, partial [Streptomyces sp. NPDC002387]|uniref:erythromycin esterase family protein n=1 Tax=Streptomyces sp. NPDC002387 TaxID=3364643 RepID=UPI00369423B9
MNALFTRTTSTADLSVQDLYMAQTLAWHLEQASPGARFVLAAHDNHIQKTAAVFDSTMAALPMGQHLARMLGGTYVAIGLTHTDDHVPEMRPDASAPVGFTLETTHLPAPGPAPSKPPWPAPTSPLRRPSLTRVRHPSHPDGNPLLEGCAPRAPPWTPRWATRTSVVPVVNRQARRAFRFDLNRGAPNRLPRRSPLF